VYEDAAWFTSTRSSGSGQCVEVAFVDRDIIAVRDSKDRAGALLTFTAAEWKAFVDGVQDGEFNPPQ
jgi:hypothetical protein